MKVIKAKSAEHAKKILREASEGGAHIIGQQPTGKCDLCGAEEETRPYGPNGENVCFSCGMKDEEAAKRQFSKQLNSAKPGRPVGSA